MTVLFFDCQPWKALIDATLSGYRHSRRAGKKELFEGLAIESLEGTTLRAEGFDVPTEKITNPIPVLYQSGYLTIKDYNFASDLYTLAYPNDEVRLGFINSLILSTGENL